jgi:hypothetical protein
MRVRVLGLLALAVVGLLFLGVPAGAATVLLLNGEEIDGELLEVSPREVTMRIGTGIVRIELRQVKDVRLASGESIWARELRTAIKRNREDLRRESAERLAEELRRKAGGGVDAAGTGQAAPDPGAGEGQAEARLDGATAGGVAFSGRFHEGIYGISVHHPLEWDADSPQEGYFTFSDPRPDAVGIWRFNITVFDALESDMDEVVATATQELETLAHYEVSRRDRVRIGLHLAQHTVGMFDLDGRVIRHDQVIIETRLRVFVLQFFAPGYVSSEGEVPEFTAVLRSLELSR